eukprot:1161196-Pelagomonas_calceolata.AAC.1
MGACMGVGMNGGIWFHIEATHMCAVDRTTMLFWMEEVLNFPGGAWSGAIAMSVANRVRQPHQLNANQQHVHLIKIKYCEDTRPGQQFKAAQRQHAVTAAACNLRTLCLPVRWPVFACVQ